MQRTLIEFGTKDRARFLSHYRPVVYQESIAELVDLDDLFDDVSEEAEEEIESWFSYYLMTTSEEDLPAIHAIDQVNEYHEQVAQAFAGALADIQFDGNPPERDTSGKQPWER